MDPIVLAAGSALVGAMATDDWERARSAAVGWWLRASPEQAETIGADLAEARYQLVAARQAGDTNAERVLVADWQIRLQLLLQAAPALMDGLLGLLHEGLTPVLPAHEQLATRSLVMSATVAGRGRVYQAGRDLHLHYQDSVRRSRRVLRNEGAVPGECPYPGLAAFGTDQAQWFFGRDELTAELLMRLDERLANGGALIVVAPSGAGKSSLLRAGLLPAIAAGALPAAGSAP
ncbi:hypothetical protein [Kitasatospora sp. NPDC087314]|uniref:nSTAND1 domain-containing NTPase n=1 Tax=Kitasatospora sp. NPDC087314 TaxID=3364068 RepID=UPI003818D541